MFDQILRLSLNNRLVVLLFAAMLMAWGIWRAPQMPVDVFPDLTAPSVTILVEAPGVSPQEIEQVVTLPIERAMNGAPGVRRVRSNSTVGLSMVHVEFDHGTDRFLARQQVAEKLQMVAAELPPNVEAPLLAPPSSIMGEVLFVGLTGDGVARGDLLLEAERNVRRRLMAIEGVAQVVLTGGARTQFQVVLRQESLALWDLTVDQVIAALEANNRTVAGGIIVDGATEYVVNGTGRLRSIDDIAAVRVAMRNDRPILVRDIASVRAGEAQRRGDGSVGREEAVVIGIQKQPDANTLELTRRIEAELDLISTSLPDGMVLHTGLLRQADFIEVALHNLREVLRDGILLVVLIVTLFLGSIRASLISTIAIPISLVAAMIALTATGSSLNTMTLGGLAIAIGELVDDAVIDVENVTRRLRENARRGADALPVLRVVLDASVEIRSSIVYATLVVILVFSPLFLLTGIEGSLLRPLGIAYLVALTASLLVAVTVTPVLCSLLLPGSRQVRAGNEPRFAAALQRWYQNPLRAAIRRPGMLALVSLVLVGGASWELGRLGRSFLPEFNEGALTIGMMTMPGTALDASSDLADVAESILLGFPEVVSVARRTGRAENDEHAIGTNYSEIEVRLRETERSHEDFLAELRERLGAVGVGEITIGQPISHRIDHMVSGTRAAVAVKVFGEDLVEMRRISAEIEEVMRTTPGVVDLYREQLAELPFIEMDFDFESLARYGLDVADVAETIEAATGSHVATWVRDGATRIGVAVRFGPEEIRDIEGLRQLTITSPTGAIVRLEQLARIERSSGPSEIARENVRRKLVVSCNVAGRDLSSVVQEIRSRVDAMVSIPDGYSVEYGGQFESAASAQRALIFAGAGALFGMLVLLYMAFSSVRDALIVMLNLPLALVGGVIGVIATGGVISVASIVGFITLFGIATRNGIMLVSHVRHLVEKEGVTDVEEAVVRGATERLVPILMTALAAGIGLVPLVLQHGEPGSEILAPMAVVILFGLLSATVLNMFVVPAIYRHLGSLAAPRLP